MHSRLVTTSDHRPGYPGDLLRLPAVIRRTGLSRSTIYRLMSEKQFPRPVKLSERAIGWRGSDIDLWSSSLTQAAP